MRCKLSIKRMKERGFLIAISLGIIAIFNQAAAMTVIDDFEDGNLDDWTGSGWVASGPAGSTVVISPAEGAFFARSGAPQLDESNTGTITSPLLSVTHENLAWDAVGWQGTGPNRFEILDATFSVLSTTLGPDSDSWSTESVSFFDVGLTAGESFYFRATDADAGSSFSWLAFDALRFTGSVVPIPAAVWFFVPAAGLLGLMGRRAV